MKLTFFNSREEHNHIADKLNNKGILVKFDAGYYDYLLISNISLSDIHQNISRISDNSSTLVSAGGELESKVEDYSNVVLLNVSQSKESEVISSLQKTGKNLVLASKGVYDLVVLAGSSSVPDIVEHSGITAFSVQQIGEIDGKLEGIDIGLGKRGWHYYKKTKKVVLSESECLSYAHGCYEMAKRIDAFNPTLVYAPIRGAKPIVDGMFESYIGIGGKPLAIHYPVTSSFVKGGRRNNIIELQRLREKQPESCRRILYVDELNSGGMIRGHYKEMLDVLGDSADIKVFGLANQYGECMSRNVQRIFNTGNEGVLEIFPIELLMTMDHRLLLTAHYTNHNTGPYSVPFLNNELEYPEVRKALYSYFDGYFSKVNRDHEELFRKKQEAINHRLVA